MYPVDGASGGAMRRQIDHTIGAHPELSLQKVDLEMVVLRFHIVVRVHSGIERILSVGLHPCTHAFLGLEVVIVQVFTQPWETLLPF